MVTYLLDTGAWIEFFRGTKKGAAVKRMIAEHDILTAESTIAEICTVALQHGENLPAMIAAIQQQATIHEVYLNLWIEAASAKMERRKTHVKFGLIDGILLAIQRTTGATIVTTDRDFSGLPDVVLL